LIKIVFRLIYVSLFKYLCELMEMIYELVWINLFEFIYWYKRLWDVILFQLISVSSLAQLMKTTYVVIW